MGCSKAASCIYHRQGIHADRVCALSPLATPPDDTNSELKRAPELRKRQQKQDETLESMLKSAGIKSHL